MVMTEFDTVAEGIFLSYVLTLALRTARENGLVM